MIMITPKRIDINGTGQYLDATQVDQGLGPALREGVYIADPTTGSAIAPVSATEGLSVKVTNATLPLPTGAATETTLDSIDSKLLVADSTPAPNSNCLLVRPVGLNIDAFGRLRVSNPVTSFAAFNEYKLNPFNWVTSVSGTGTVTYSTTTKMTTLATGGTASGARAVMQSRAYQRYVPGKSLYIDTTFLMQGVPPTNCVKRVGYFDDDNGIFLEYRSTGVFLVLRSRVSGSIVDTAVPQVDWDDSLNGEGASGITLNLAYGQIFWIDLQYLGMGMVRTGFNIDGGDVVAYRFKHANVTATQPYMATANLPVRFEIVNTGIASASADMAALCAKVDSEGGFDLDGIQYSASNGVTGKATTTTLIPLVSIRPGPTYNGLTNRGWIIPQGAQVYATGTNLDIYYQIIWNATLTGASWTAVNTNAMGQFDVSATAVSLGNGVVVDDGHLGLGTSKSSSALNDIFSARPLVNSFDGLTPDTLTLAARTVSGSGTCYGSMTWHGHW